MAMIVLLVLTIIGVSALSITSLEAKMAGNTQDLTRAFEAAESGFNIALNTPGLLDLHNQTEDTFDIDEKRSGYATVTTKFLTFSPPKRGSGFSAVNYDSANFDQKSLGETTSGAKSVLHQGTSQIVNKNE
jgi:hypothetical protein